MENESCNNQNKTKDDFNLFEDWMPLIEKKY